MGFFGDIFDLGMKAAYVFSAGFVGKSDDGYHIGPLRVSDNSCSIVCKTGLLNLELKLSRSDCGSWQPAVGIGLGIPGRAEIRVEAQKTKEGFTVAQSLSVNAGPVKINGGLTIDQDFNVTKPEVTGKVGPLYAKFKNINDNDNERFVEAGIQAYGLKTTTTLDLKDDVDFEKIYKNTKVDIDYEYLKNKVAEEFYGEESEEDEDEKEEKKNKQAERKDKFYCDICKSFNCEFNK